MPVSPICLVNSTPTTNGVTVSPNTVVSIQLNDTSLVTTWFLQIFSTDELTTGGAISLANVNHTTNQVTSPSSVVTFTFPNTLGSTLIFLSTVMGTGGPVATTFGVFTLTSAGYRVGAVGQTREGDAAFGWASILNPIIRATGTGGVTLESNGTPIGGNPHSTLNFSGIQVSDSGGGIALISSSPGAQDNAVAARTFGGRDLRNLTVTDPTNISLDGSIPIIADSINGAHASITSFATPHATVTGLSGMYSGLVGSNLVLTGAATSANNGSFVIATVISSTSVTITNASAVAPDANNGSIKWSIPNSLNDKAGISLVPVGPYLYFSGYDTDNHVSGAIYGINLVSKKSLSSGVSLAQLTTDIVVDMTYGSWSVPPSGGDVLFIGGAAGLFVYKVQSDGTLVAGTGHALPGGASTVRVCFVGTGQQSQPQFAVTSTNGIVYIFDPAAPSAVHTGVAAIAGFVPGPIVFDNNGFVWVLYWNSGTTTSRVVQYSINRSTYVLTAVQTVTLSASRRVTDIVSDGRWLHALDTAGQHYAVDLSTGAFQTTANDFFNESTDATFARLVFDGKALVASIIPAVSDTAIALRFHPDTTELLSTIATTTVTGDQPRAICVDSGGQIIVAVSTTTAVQNQLSLMFSYPRAALIENLSQPISFPDGGRLQGELNATPTFGASVTAVVGSTATITGLLAIPPSAVGQNLTLFGATSPGNNGTFLITARLSSTSVQITNASAVAPDASNGGIAWSLPFQLDPYHLIATVGSFAGPTTVVFPPNPTQDMLVMVTDTGSAAATHNISVTSSGGLINVQDPNFPFPAFSTGAILTVSGCCVVWMYTNGQWRIISSYYPDLLKYRTLASTTTSTAISGPVDLRVSAAAALTVSQVGQSMSDGQRCRIKDVLGNFATRNVTVTPHAGLTIEDPNTPGTYSSSILLSVNGASVEWELDSATSKLELV